MSPQPTAQTREIRKHTFTTFSISTTLCMLHDIATAYLQFLTHQAITTNYDYYYYY